ncbi:MAG: PA14 domain-containing protein [Chloroflexota bacterium]|nr:PA14 domain-containing protein [Chloroflexota bacterium]
MLEGTPTETATFLPTLTLDFPTPVRTLMPEPVMPEIEAISFDAPYVSDWDYAEEVLEPRDSGFALHFRSEWYVRSRVPVQNDIILSANVRMTGGRFSIYTHVTDIAWYRFAISASGLVELYRGEQVVASASIGAIPDTWITVRFSSTSGNLRVSVQGVEVLTFADDAPLPPGKVWLGTDGIPEGEIWVDEIAVSGNIPLPEIVPPVTEQTLASAPEGLGATAVTEVIAFDYQLNTEGNYAIYTISPSGTGLTNLTSDWTNSAELDPVLSPDGSKIAFVSNRNPQGGSTIDYNIWVMDSDGTDRRQITAHAANDYSPTWRRDGQALAFVSNRNNNESIFVIGVNETSSQAGVLAAVGKNPDYSPVNDELAFSVYNGGTGTNDIYIINAPANPYFIASAPYAADFEPTWSNNGNEILFRALAPAPSPQPGMHNWIYYTSRQTGPWLTTNITNSNTQYGPIKPDYSPSGAQMVAWYDTGLYIANMSPIPLIFARINQTNYNTNNPDWGISNPPPQIPPGTGLLGTYHNGTNLSSPSGTRYDPKIDIDFINDPLTGLGITATSPFSVRWRGTIRPPLTGNYRFYTGSDDGVRVWVNGILLIDNWGTQGHPPNPPAGLFQSNQLITLQAGQAYSIKVEYFNGPCCGARITLWWELAGQITTQIIPQQYLYPPETQTCTGNGGSGLPGNSGNTVTVTIGKDTGSNQNDILVPIYANPRETFDVTGLSVQLQPSSYANEQLVITVIGRYRVRPDGINDRYWYRVSYARGGATNVGWITNPDMLYILDDVQTSTCISDIGLLPEQDRDGATVCTLLNPSATGASVSVFLAPITGNPQIAGDLAAANTLVIRARAYAINPSQLGSHTWLRVRTYSDPGSITDGWVRIADASAYPANQPNGWLRTPIAELNACSTLIPNQTAQYPFAAANTWSAAPTTIVPFNTYPVSADDTCRGGVTYGRVDGWGYYAGTQNPMILYSPNGLHYGTDFFVPQSAAQAGTEAYSIGANGIVVGIGISEANGNLVPGTASVWRANSVAGARGYAVIVRYGHLFVLYGHLLYADLPLNVYVGAPVSTGQVLGYVGTFPNSDPHLHLEVRTAGLSTAQEDASFMDINGSDQNEYGILATDSSQQALIHTYDPMQFFVPTVGIPDNSSGSIGLFGLNNVPNNNDQLLQINGFNCPVRYRTLSMGSGASGTVTPAWAILPNGYRGQLLAGSGQAAEDPAIRTTYSP